MLIKINMGNAAKIATSVLACVVVYTFVTWIGREDNVPVHLQHYIRFNESYKKEQEARDRNISLSNLWATLDRRNEDQTLQNWGTYGPIEEDTPVLVILVRGDAERLQYLIVSLYQVQGIESVLLIFSHSCYDERIDELIISIDFCRVKQIYYPNSVQLYPTSFPGSDPTRDGQMCEGKHHWWWTAHTVFGDTWPWYYGHRGSVTFIREDSYVLPDFIHMMRFAHRALSHIPEAEVLSFGRPQVRLGAKTDYNKLTVRMWKPMYANGLTMNRSTWRKILDQSSEFCQYDDTSWSYSLAAVFRLWPRGRLVCVSTVTSRVLTVTGSGRESLASLAPALRVLWSNLYPIDVQAVLLYDHQGLSFEYTRPPPQGNGGWADFRDITLCFEPMMLIYTEEDSTIETIPNYVYMTNQ